MADKIVVLNAGRIEQVGSPMELYDRPATVFVAGFIGSPRMNLIDGAAAGEAGVATYGIRPEHLRLSPEGGRWAGVVRHVERLGADSIVHLTVAGMGELVARIPGSEPIAVGQAVHATPDPARECRFDALGQAVGGR